MSSSIKNHSHLFFVTQHKEMKETQAFVPYYYFLWDTLQANSNNDLLIFITSRSSNITWNLNIYWFSYSTTNKRTIPPNLIMVSMYKFFNSQYIHNSFDVSYHIRQLALAISLWMLGTSASLPCCLLSVTNINEAINL